MARPWPWQRDDASRFAEISWFHHGFSPVGPWTPCRPGSSQLVDCEPIDLRSRLAYARSLGRLWPPVANATSRLIYLDVGANEPLPKPRNISRRGRRPRTVLKDTSLAIFRRRYTHGENFSIFAFEPDPGLAEAWSQPRVAELNATLVPAAVGTFDGAGYFSASSGLGANLARHPDKDHTRRVRVLDFGRWLKDNVRHEDWVVAKIDIEKGEFELMPQLLRQPSTLRLIDEMFFECHHRETWWNGPHVHSECLQLARDLQAAGVWTHEWF